MRADQPAATSTTESTSQEGPRASRPVPLPHRIVGMVESPGRVPDVITDGVLTVSGWTLTGAGDAAIEVFVNGVLRGNVSYGESRPDAAALYPEFPAATNCGFLGEIGVGDLPDGMHSATIRISASDGAQAELSTSFEVDNHAFENGRIIGRLDQPNRGAIFVPWETVTLSGWALAPSGVNRVEVFVDGQARGPIDHQVLRPDIARTRRQYADAEHCGFAGTVPLSLPLDPVSIPQEGSHELRVVVTANDGRQQEISTRIEVVIAGIVDGGMPHINRQYSAWLEQRDKFLAAMPGTVATIDSRLIFEIIVPLEGHCDDGLEAVVASLQAQTYPQWRLTLVDSGNVSDGTREYGRHLASEDRRVSYREPSGDGIVTDLNAALAGCNADWVGILSPGVIIAPFALAAITRELAANPDARLVYTDDDRMDPDSMERWNPFFKPDWSPDLLLSMNYLGPLTLLHRETAFDVGGLREGISGAEVYDLALRVTEQFGQAHHVSDILATSIAM